MKEESILKKYNRMMYKSENRKVMAIKALILSSILCYFTLGLARAKNENLLLVSIILLIVLLLAFVLWYFIFYGMNVYYQKRVEKKPEIQR